MDQTYFEDIALGTRIRSARRTITEADIVMFSGLSGDFGALHNDRVFIEQETDFKAPIAAGLHIASVVTGLRSELDSWVVTAFLECRRKFKAPVYAGDTISFEYEVTEARPRKSRADSGVVQYDVRVYNQDGELVQEGEDVVLVATRAGAASRA